MHIPSHSLLTQALPLELTGSGHGWFTQYRRYPVYSPAWVRGRWHLTGTVLFTLMGVLVLTSWLAADAFTPTQLQGFLISSALKLLGLAAAMLLGPALAGWIRQRHWPPSTEWRALLLAMLGIACIGLPYSVFDPTHQGLLTFVVPSDEPPDPRHQSVLLDLMRMGFDALTAFVAGGGIGLWAWQRERRALIQLEQERALQQAQQETSEAELRLSVLAAQVEPHFLFNTLAGVRSAIATDPERAASMIDHLVQYLRSSIPKLRADGTLLSHLGEQFELVRAYLALMRARMPRLHYSTDIEPKLEEAHCPPLMLISLVENAVKHGVEPKLGQAHIHVTARRLEDGRIEVSVEDDGVGFQAASNQGGLGLANIQARLQGIYGGDAALVLKARPQGGVIAQLLLPGSQLQTPEDTRS